MHQPSIALHVHVLVLAEKLPLYMQNRRLSRARQQREYQQINEKTAARPPPLPRASGVPSHAIRRFLATQAAQTARAHSPPFF